MTAYLESASPERWVESAFETEGPLYWATMSILLHSHQQWKNNKIAHLRRLIILAQARNTGSSKTLSDKKEKEYSVYKPYLVFYGLVDGIYKYFFKVSALYEHEIYSFPNYLKIIEILLLGKIMFKC